jgi:lipoprotein-anchoring transpeptidase ErfK/SrfK
MKIRQLPLLVFGSLVILGSGSEAKFFEHLLGKAGRKLDNTFRNCSWDYNDPTDLAISNFERLTTALPEGLNRRVNPFKESDFQTRPYLREFEFVIVVNNSNSIRQNESLPSGLPLSLPSLESLGIIDVQRVAAKKSPSFVVEQNNQTTDSAPAPLSDEELSILRSKEFNAQYGDLAMKVRRFGTVQKDARNKVISSGIQGAQTIRVYQRGRLIRVARVSTGRHEFELRDRTITCGNRPAESYYSVTESGYYNFQELLKEYKSKSFDDADMPNTMFYIRNRGIALHEVNLPEKLAHLGTRASGGCTRMDPDTASSLFEAVLATQGSQIPVVDVYGNPVLDIARRQAYKRTETVVYSPGTSRERRVTLPSYSALLIVQPDSVQPLDPYLESQAQFRYQGSN